MKLLNIKGQRFGKWTALIRADSRNGNTYWKCVCDCGNTKNVHLGSLRNGSSKSCGCVKEGENFYSVIGRIGGLASRGGGFAKRPELAIEAGRKGGTRTQELIRKGLI